jgi:hypothetical protein
MKARFSSLDGFFINWLGQRKRDETLRMMKHQYGKNHAIRHESNVAESAHYYNYVRRTLFLAQRKTVATALAISPKKERLSPLPPVTGSTT